MVLLNRIPLLVPELRVQVEIVRIRIKNRNRPFRKKNGSYSLKKNWFLIQKPGYCFKLLILKLDPAITYFKYRICCQAFQEPDPDTTKISGSATLSSTTNTEWREGVKIGILLSFYRFFLICYFLLLFIYPWYVTFCLSFLLSFLQKKYIFLSFHEN